MSAERKLEATGKNIEGKLQEFVGNLTGNPQDIVEGQAKQSEAEMRHHVENVREKQESSGLPNRLEATGKNIEGKLQEFVGDVTGNPRDKVEGKTKQAEAHVRHTVENIKDSFK